LKKTAEEIRLIIMELHFINIQFLMDLKLVVKRFMICVILGHKTRYSANNNSLAK